MNCAAVMSLTFELPVIWALVGYDADCLSITPSMPASDILTLVLHYTLLGLIVRFRFLRFSDLRCCRSEGSWSSS